MSLKLLRITTVPVSLNVLLKGQLRFMKDHGLDVVAVSADGPEVEEVCKREGVTHEIVDFTRKISPLKDLKALKQLVRVIKKHRPDIIHTHTPKAGLLGMIAGLYCKVPVRMHTVPGIRMIEIFGVKQKLLLFTEWLTYQLATKVYPNSVNLRRFVENNISISPKKLKVIGNGSTNGIDTEFFSEEKTPDLNIREKYKIPKDDFVFLFIGRLVKDKGIRELVYSFMRINEDYIHTHLVLVGPFEQYLDPLPRNIRETVKYHPKITLTGFQKDVRPYLKGSDAFVFPSYREGFPNVVMQAGAFNLPTIVSDINGCNEIIRNQQNGLVVRRKSEKELYEAMKRILLDEDLRNLFMNNIRKSITDRFEQKTIWVLLYNEYVKQLGAKGVKHELKPLDYPGELSTEGLDRKPVNKKDKSFTKETTIQTS